MTVIMRNPIKSKKCGDEVKIEEIKDFFLSRYEEDEKKALNYFWYVNKVIEEIQSNEEEKTIYYRGKGFFSYVFQIGNKIIKFGTDRVQYRIPYVKEILQPLLRKKIGEDFIIEVSENVNTKWYEELDEREAKLRLYSLWKAIRKKGVIWADIDLKNTGELLRDNTIYWKPYFRKSDNSFHDLQIENERLGIDGTEKKEILHKGDLVIIDTDMLYTEEDIKKLQKKGVMFDDILYVFMQRYEREKKEEEKMRQQILSID